MDSGSLSALNGIICLNDYLIVPVCTENLICVGGTTETSSPPFLFLHLLINQNPKKAITMDNCCPNG
jgi:hypothetical protein